MIKDKVAFLDLPTPLEFLPRLSEELGLPFWIKRDDLTGLGGGGNKLRKLEYILEDALAQGATMLMTEGGIQTNHGRLTAAVAAKYGLKCAILSIGQYPGELSGNMLLSRILGADLIIKKSDGRPGEEQLRDLKEAMLEKYRSQGEVVYYIPLGGTQKFGIAGYVEAGQELAEQLGQADIANPRVFSAVGSMGTFLGLSLGLQDIPLTGIAIMDHGDTSQAKLRDLAQDYLGRAITEPLSFDVRQDFVRGGYNLESAEVREAIYLMARKEGILLDPCYTGKLFAGILDLIKRGDLAGQSVVMVHTGGWPGLYTKHHRLAMEADLVDGLTILE